MKHLLNKITAIIVIILLLPFLLVKNTYATSIETLAYVTAIGFDLSEKNIMTITFQFAKLISTDQSGSSQPQNSETISIDCTSFDAGLALINSYMSKKVNLSHCEIIVFSEAFASNNISKEINILASNIEIRPNCNILITKSLAKDFLNNSKPTLTNLTAKYYEILLNSNEYTGFLAKAPLWKFYISLKSHSSEAIAVLAGLNGSFVDDLSLNETSLMDADTGYIPGEIPLSAKTISETMGLAVFFQDKLVGELNALESISYLILTNQLDSCNISIPNPFTNNDTINVMLELSKHTKNNVSLVNNSPYIKTNISLNAYITSVNSTSNYSKLENLDIIQDYIESYIQANINSFLYKTSKKFKSDIVGFGKNIIPKYKTIDDWKTLKWSNLYRDSFFNVTVNIKIKSGSLFIKN